MAHEVAQGDKHYLREDADLKAQLFESAELKKRLRICALRSADSLMEVFITSRNLTHNLFFYFQQFLVLISNSTAGHCKQ